MAPGRAGGSLDISKHELWQHALHPDELAVCISYVPLQMDDTGPLQHLFAVGTALSLGEDHPCTGRLLLIRATLQPSKPSAPLGSVVHTECGPVMLHSHGLETIVYDTMLMLMVTRASLA